MQKSNTKDPIIVIFAKQWQAGAIQRKGPFKVYQFSRELKCISGAVKATSNEH